MFTWIKVKYRTRSIQRTGVSILILNTCFFCLPLGNHCFLLNYEWAYTFNIHTQRHIHLYTYAMCVYIITSFIFSTRRGAHMSTGLHLVCFTLYSGDVIITVYREYPFLFYNCITLHFIVQ